MICVDQETGEKDPNILITLRDLRRSITASDANSNKVPLSFGVYLNRRVTNNPLGNQAKLIVGSQVRLVRRSNFAGI